jgi:hypothetical protein
MDANGWSCIRCGNTSTDEPIIVGNTLMCLECYAKRAPKSHGCYTIQRQRELLDQCGIPHVKGRSYDEAEDIIKRLIAAGDLPRNTVNSPTTKQLDFLVRHGISYQPDCTKDEASNLIQAKIDEMNDAEPMSEAQRGYIVKLGGSPGRHMSKLQASKFIDHLHDLLKCRKCGCSFVPGEARCYTCGGYVPKLGGVKPPRAIYTPKGFWESLFW